MRVCAQNTFAPLLPTEEWMRMQNARNQKWAAPNKEEQRLCS